MLLVYVNIIEGNSDFKCWKIFNYFLIFLYMCGISLPVRKNTMYFNWSKCFHFCYTYNRYKRHWQVKYNVDLILNFKFAFYVFYTQILYLTTIWHYFYLSVSIHPAQLTSTLLWIHDLSFFIYFTHTQTHPHSQAHTQHLLHPFTNECIYLCLKVNTWNCVSIGVITVNSNFRGITMLWCWI